jgi:hypothetical protein
MRVQITRSARRQRAVPKTLFQDRAVLCPDQPWLMTWSDASTGRLPYE